MASGSISIAKGKEMSPILSRNRAIAGAHLSALALLPSYPELKFAYNLSIARNGTLYFLGYAGGLRNNFGIYRSELIEGEYAKPELLQPGINASEGIRNWTPYIAPDESYLLFSSSRGTSEMAQGDLFICFRQPDGNWTDPVSLGESINSNQLERFPSVSPDGKYLFFTRWTPDHDEDVYWVSASIIGKLKEKAIQENGSTLIIDKRIQSEEKYSQIWNPDR